MKTIIKLFAIVIVCVPAFVEAALLERTLIQYQETDLGSGATFVAPEKTVTEQFAGDGSSQTAAEEFSYDPSTGNVLQHTQFGAVQLGTTGYDYTDVGSDKRTTNYQYASSSTQLVTNRVASQELRDAADDLVAAARFYYDELPFGVVDKGNVTTQSDLVVGSNYVNKNWTYNEAGLVTSETDPNGNTTQYTYDSYLLYPERITNALLQEYEYEYDYRFGEVSQTTDPNGVVITTDYDGFGRPLNRYEPHPQTGESTLVEYYEYDDTPGAITLTKHTVLSDTITVTSISYLDGFGRTIQTRTIAEDTNQYVVQDYVYGEAGKLVKESLPYFDAGSDRSNPTTEDALYAEYTYDGLGRIVSVQNAAGITTTNFGAWTERVTDALGNQKKYTYDAFGRLAGVTEYLDGVAYDTTYIWNANDTLTGITDASGNIRTISYDGLGRRLALQDLHDPSDTTFGVWNFTYDAAGNVVTTVDPNGSNITHTYDTLNRMVAEAADGVVTTTYAHDTCINGVGLLCSVQNGGVTTGYTYNQNTGVAEETKTIAGIAYQSQYHYDLQGNQIMVIEPDDSEVTYIYNDAGQLEQVLQQEAGGEVNTIVADIDYGPHGLVTYQSFGNNTETIKTYDATQLYRLSNILTTSTTTLGVGGPGGELALLEEALETVAESVIESAEPEPTPEEVVEEAAVTEPTVEEVLEETPAVELVASSAEEEALEEVASEPKTETEIAEVVASTTPAVEPAASSTDSVPEAPASSTTPVLPVLQTLTIEEDNSGSAADEPVQFASIQAVVEAVESVDTVIAEVNQLALDATAQTIILNHTFNDPVILIDVITANTNAPVEVRIDNVSGGSFDAWIQAPDTGGTISSTETVSYLVVERGVHELDNGVVIEADTFNTNKLTKAPGFETISYTASYTETPVVLSQVQTNNDPAFVRTRQQGSTATNFQIALEEEELTSSGMHAEETIGWVAISSGAANLSRGGEVIAFEAIATPVTARHYLLPYNFTQSFTQSPVVLATLASYQGGDPAGVRMASLRPASIRFKAEEDTSNDAEVSHTTEGINYFAFGEVGLITLSSRSATTTTTTEPVDPEPSPNPEPATSTPEYSGADQVFAEVGTVEANDTVQVITLEHTYTNPIVVANIVTTSSADPVEVRIDAIASNSFEIWLQEADYLDGTHNDETVQYLVIERGIHELENGVIIEADTLNTNNLTKAPGFETVPFTAAFNSAPVVLSQVQTNNDPAFVRTRQQPATTASFKVALEEEELTSTGAHSEETIGWVAVTKTAGDLARGDTAVPFVADVTTDRFTHSFATEQFVQTFTAAPVLLGVLGSYDGPDAAGIRMTNLQAGSVQFRTEEDQSKDSETNHTSERINYVAFGSDGILTIPGTGTSTGTTTEPVDPEPATTTPEYEEQDQVFAETGVRTLTNQATTVLLQGTYDDPVILTNPTTNTSAIEVRIDNISSNSFDAWLQAPDTGSVTPGTETVSYMVIERGIHELENGVIIEADTLNTNNLTKAPGFETVPFTAAFNSAPVVLSQVQTNNDPAFVRTRQQPATTASFKVALEEEEASQFGSHGIETIGWMAITRGANELDRGDQAIGFEAITTPTVVTHSVSAFTFTQTFTEAPVMLGVLGSFEGGDPTGLRIESIQPNSVRFRAQEDTTADTEMNHWAEKVQYVAVAEAGVLTKTVLVEAPEEPTFPVFREVVQDLRYTYDAVGNITLLTDHASDTAATTTYAYDDLYRLTEANVFTASSSTPDTRSYQYDILGNILEKSDRGIYTYAGAVGTNFANPHAVTDIAGVGYTYDSNGNLTSTTDGTTNTWNYRNELTQSITDGEVVTYTYDQSGQRVQKISDTDSTTYVSGSYEVKNGSTTKQIYAGEDVVATIEADTPAPTIYYNHLDHLGSTRAVTDDIGYVNQLLDYHPFGSTKLDTQLAEVDQTKRYTGHDYDKETDLSYMGARYYAGDTGRFISIDPVALALGDWTSIEEMAEAPAYIYLQHPQYHNAYTYALNNPLKYIDPQGEAVPLIALAVIYSPQILAWTAALASPLGVAMLVDDHQTIINDPSGLEIALIVAPGTLGKVGGVAKVSMNRAAWSPAKAGGNAGDAAKSLSRHYEKHGDLVNAKSAQDYYNKANDAMRSDSGFTRLNNKDGSIDYYNQNRKELVGVNSHGEISTYHKVIKQTKIEGLDKRIDKKQD